MLRLRVRIGSIVGACLLVGMLQPAVANAVTILPNGNGEAFSITKMNASGKYTEPYFHAKSRAQVCIDITSNNNVYSWSYAMVKRSGHTVRKVWASRQFHGAGSKCSPVKAAGPKVAIQIHLLSAGTNGFSLAGSWEVNTN
jgi:hypothetical protein